MTKQISSFKKYFTLLIFIVTFFILGGFLACWLIQNTNLIRLDYHAKYIQLNNSEKKPRTKVYIDFFNGYLLRYPDLYYPSIDYPNFDEDFDNGVKFLDFQNSQNLPFASIGREGVIKQGSSLKNQMMQAVYDMYGINVVDEKAYLNGWKYTDATINGNEAVIAEFEMTQAIYDALPDYLKTYSDSGEIIKNIKKPVGFKNKIVWIRKNKDHFIDISTDRNLEDEVVEGIFDRMINSFKFLY